jgi:hypothetical protein
MKDVAETRWLLLIHQIPPKPSYFRVKIWRRLQQLGAVPIKQSVYVLPKNEQTLEDFSWTLREIKGGGGEASICEAAFIDGITDDQIVAMFRESRKLGYEEIIRDTRSILAELSPWPAAQIEDVSHADGHLARLQKKMAELTAIDYFECPDRGVAELLLANLSDQLKGGKSAKRLPEKTLRELTGKTWVTRKNVYVDRIACAWLIRRFVDPTARFKFVDSKKYKPLPNELRFDMFDAEFTHAADLCSFEVMIRRLGLDPKLLATLAEVVHDIDLREEKFGRPETAGLKMLFSAIVTAHPGDEERIEIGGNILDDLFEHDKQQNRTDAAGAERGSQSRVLRHD